MCRNALGRVRPQYNVGLEQYFFLGFPPVIFFSKLAQNFVREKLQRSFSSLSECDQLWLDGLAPERVVVDRVGCVHRVAVGPSKDEVGLDDVAAGAELVRGLEAQRLELGRTWRGGVTDAV